MSTKHQRTGIGAARDGATARALRSMLFSVLLGFHNAWEMDDAGLEELSARFHIAHREPVDQVLSTPERCFFWGESSLLN